MDLEDRGLMTEAGRHVFEKAFEYEIVSPDSEISKRMQEVRNPDHGRPVNPFKIPLKRYSFTY